MTNFIVGTLYSGEPFLKMNFDRAYDPRTEFSSFKVYTNRAKAQQKLEKLKAK